MAGQSGVEGPEAAPEQAMSRGEREEVTVNLSAVEDLQVTDEYGRKIRFGDLYRNKKSIIIFVRHFLCFICKEYVEDLAKIPDKYLKEKDTQVIVIGCAPYKFIAPFRQTTGYKYGLYCDPDRELYKAMGLNTHLKAGKLKDSKHVKSNYFMGVLRSTWRGMKFAEFQGNVHQQGGAFIFGPGNNVHFSHVDQHSTDHVAINDLLVHAGVDLVNFTKDTRELTI